MKNLKALYLLFLGLTLIACGSSDDDGGGTPEPLTGDYYPSTVDNLWTYDVVNTNPDDETFNFNVTEALKVSAGTADAFMLTSTPDPANGSMNAFLTNGTLSRTDDKLLFNGDIALPAEFSGFSDEIITLSNIPLYDLNAANGELSSTSGTINQDFDLNGTVVPLNIEYTFTTSKLGTASNLTVGSTTYNDVIKGNLALEASVTTTVDLLGTGSPSTVSVLSTQDILTIDYYFAKDIGLIKADAVQGYEVDETFVNLLGLIPDFELTIPTAISVTNVQDIASFVSAE